MSPVIALGFALSLPTLVAGASEEDSWPSWRGPLGTGSLPENRPPVEWSSCRSPGLPSRPSGLRGACSSSLRVRLERGCRRLASASRVWPESLTSMQRCSAQRCWCASSACERAPGFAMVASVTGFAPVMIL